MSKNDIDLFCQDLQTAVDLTEKYDLNLKIYKNIDDKELKCWQEKIYKLHFSDTDRSGRSNSRESGSTYDTSAGYQGKERKESGFGTALKREQNDQSQGSDSDFSTLKFTISEKNYLDKLKYWKNFEVQTQNYKSKSSSSIKNINPKKRSTGSYSSISYSSSNRSSMVSECSSFYSSFNKTLKTWKEIENQYVAADSVDNYGAIVRLDSEVNTRPVTSTLIRSAKGKLDLYREACLKKLALIVNRLASDELMSDQTITEFIDEVENICNIAVPEAAETLIKLRKYEIILILKTFLNLKNYENIKNNLKIAQARFDNEVELTKHETIKLCREFLSNYENILNILEKCLEDDDFVGVNEIIQEAIAALGKEHPTVVKALKFLDVSWNISSLIKNL